MTILRTRGQIVSPTEGVSLKAYFYDLTGNPVDPISFPQVSLIQPSGNVVLAPTSSGVYRLDVGIYGYDYYTSVATTQGVWMDRWRAQIPSGQIITKEYNFTILYTQTPLVNSDGYEALGDDVGFHYSQVAIRNINKLLKGLRARLKSSGKTVSSDSFGNKIFVDCDIYSLDQLITFLAMSLSNFNEIPHFTLFTFDHTQIIDQFYEVLVQGATLIALSSQALIERGREFTIADNGLNFTPPTISELLNTEWQTEFTNYFEKVKLIKITMKPAPIVLCSLTGTIFRSPQLAKLRWLRARQIF